MSLQNYIDTIKSQLSQNLIIDSFSIVTERILFNRGYFRARLSLKNEDFLEIAESFTVIDNRLITLSYRYQWMDGNKQQLKKRGDKCLVKINGIFLKDIKTQLGRANPAVVCPIHFC
ncbi:MAG: hypothetical protein ACRCT1_18450 [Microcoleaceae cyanobacterium]